VSVFAPRDVQSFVSQVLVSEFATFCLHQAVVVRIACVIVHSTALVIVRCLVFIHQPRRVKMLSVADLQMESKRFAKSRVLAATRKASLLWHLLPAHLLRLVFSFSKTRDYATALRSCKGWSNAADACFLRRQVIDRFDVAVPQGWARERYAASQLS
jgi:hypothetical protein